MNPVRKLRNTMRYNNFTIKLPDYFLTETLPVDFLSGMNPVRKLINMNILKSNDKNSQQTVLCREGVGFNSLTG